MGEAAEILALEERRRAAMLADDVETLRTLLAPDLRYVHSTGGVESQGSLLKLLASGQTVYRQLAFALAVTRTADAAIVSGEMRALVQRVDVQREIATCYLAVWLRRAGAWQLAAFQGTSLPAR
ncbi:nuclear transport factor 2 family protein [Xenophilus sp.]|uniref:nuclear transport factor 2 family protein n=1 Tax=Xenophilus sp. TaxID=1873499 RepID=UPI0037DCBEAB